MLNSANIAWQADQNFISYTSLWTYWLRGKIFQKFFIQSATFENCIDKWNNKSYNVFDCSKIESIQDQLNKICYELAFNRKYVKKENKNEILIDLL